MDKKSWLVLFALDLGITYYILGINSVAWCHPLQFNTSACSWPMHSFITLSIMATREGISARDSICLALDSTVRISCRIDLIPMESIVDLSLWAVLPTCSQFSAARAAFRSTIFWGTVSIKSVTIFLIKVS